MNRAIKRKDEARQAAGSRGTRVEFADKLTYLNS